ncbi:MAG: tetratricopeptide repeat protein [Pirellulales bacterium]
MSNAARSQEGPSLAGVRVALVGRLSGMSRRDAQRLIRQHGGVALDKADATVHLLVVADDCAADSASSKRFALQHVSLNEPTRAAIARGDVKVVSESELWQRLGLVDEQRDVQRLYTPAMLANLLKVDVAIVRRWQRRGLIQPTRTVRRLAYFDFEQVLVTRRLAALLAAGVSPAALERRFVAPRGQQWFSFASEADGERRSAASASADAAEHGEILSLTGPAGGAAPSPGALVQMAEELEEQGELAAAADVYRAALAAGGPNADLAFALAELFYRLGDLSAARERYFMAIEFDENFVEARVNLGCLFAEQGRLDMAAAAFEGALRYHTDYADAHYHLAKTLSELGRRDEALTHWEAFLRFAPDSPWAAEVRLLVAIADRDVTGAT